MYKKIKAIDYFVQLKNKKIGMVKYYAYVGGRKYAFIDEYRIKKIIDHHSEVELTNVKLYAPIEYITDKYLYFYIKGIFSIRHYITIMPNKYEKE